jgi:FMN-dependent NADH-azoreductase
MKLLRIDSSARGKSVSRQLTEAFVAAWRKQCPDGEIIRRDLISSAIPSISDEWVTAARTEPAKRGSADRQVLALSDELIGELDAANLILIGAPMYNFTISAPLKAWIDQIVRPGKTVQYGPGGQKGLLDGKKVVVVASRGGAYSDGAARSGLDYQESYLRKILAFIGLTDVTFIHAENQLRPDQADPSRDAALKKIDEFVGFTPWTSIGNGQAARTSNPS